MLRRFLLTLGFLVLSLVSARAQGGFDITPVARPGDPVRAPATLVSASEPRLSDTGEVLFRGDGGLLLASPEGHLVIAAPGDRTPDGRLIVAIGDASVNARGRGGVRGVADVSPRPRLRLKLQPSCCSRKERSPRLRRVATRRRRRHICRVRRGPL